MKFSYWKLIFVSAIFILFSLNLSAQNYKRICVIGSSSAWGYFPNTSIPRDSAWAFKIKKYYKDLGVIDTLFNIATVGNDCYNGMPTSYVPPLNRRLPDPASNITRAVNLVPKPDIIIVNFPSNSYDFLSIDEVIFCLQTIKDSANAKNIDCYITTTQPRDNFSVSERQKLKDIGDRIRFTFGPRAIDFYYDIVNLADLSIKAEYSLGDGVHLNPAGHTVLKNKVIAKNLFFAIVPVNFSLFTTIYKEGKVYIQWQTLSEINNQKFIIEKSNDAVHFFPIETVNAKTNSAATKNYFAQDIKPFNGKNYYRIETVSLDNRSQYSDISFVKCNYTGQVKTNLYPTMSSDHVFLLFNCDKKLDVSVAIIDLNGREVYSKKMQVENAEVHNIDISHLSNGNYICRINYSGKEESHRFIKTN